MMEAMAIRIADSRRSSHAWPTCAVLAGLRIQSLNSRQLQLATAVLPDNQMEMLDGSA